MTSVAGRRATATARSYLFVPGDQPKMLSKAASRGADALIIDLEDAVGLDLKGVARRETRSWLQTEEAETLPVWVRLNNEPSLIGDDIVSALVSVLSGFVIPKVEAADQLEQIGAILDVEERRMGLEQGTIRLIPMVESARGLLAVAELALSPRVERLMVGEVDLAADLQLDSPDEQTMAPLRMPLVVASTAAGIEPPVGPVSTDYRDLERLRNGTIGLRRMGFRARPAIHPSQIEVINSVFTPTPEEVERARQLLHLYEQAEEEGRGAVVDEDGRMVDKAVVRSARRTVELADLPQGG